MPFDAFIFQSFGGPNKRSDVIPFLENVTRGRNIPIQRLQTVAEQYYMFDGKSPINQINLDIIERLTKAFKAAEIDLPIYFGNRNFEPYISDTLSQMKTDGIKNAMTFVTSAYGSFSSCKQYKLDIVNAQNALGPEHPSVTKIRHYYSHPGFINPFIDASVTELGKLNDPLKAEFIFTAHSIPVAMSMNSPYLSQLNEAMELVIEGIASVSGFTPRHSLVFQSRSGPPSQPWLEPDISSHIRELASKGIKEVIVAPIGFISDHLEVIYDLDILAAETAREVGISMHRVATPSSSPQFIDMIVDLTLELLKPDKKPTTLTNSISLKGCTSSCCTLSN